MTFETKKAISGIKWTTFNQLITNGITVFTSIILMRFLSPEEFGFVAMITVVAGFISSLGQTGLGSSLIFKEKLTQLDISSVSIFQIALGLLFSICLFLASDLIAQFYNNVKLAGITQLFSITFFLNALGSIAASLLRKDLRFKEIFISSFFSTLAGAFIAVFLALNNFGAYSLVWQYIVTALIASVVSLHFSGNWRLNSFSTSVLKEHFNYSLPLLGNSIFNYWSKNSDNLIIGKFLGAESLGLYSRSYTFMMLPARRVTVALSGVLFPSLVKIKNEREELIRMFLGFNSLVAFFITPIMVILIISARSIVMLIMGSEWLGMIESFQILCVAGWIQSATLVLSKMYMVLGITSRLFFVNVITGILAIVGYLLGAQFNIEVVATAYVLVSIITVILFIKGIARHLELKTIYVAKQLLFYFLVFSILTISGLVINQESSLPHQFTVGLVVSLVMIIYFSLIYIFNRSDILITKRLIRKYILR